MPSFLDMFSDRAREYARYRPSYLIELFDWVASAAPAQDVVWDCATGSGQAAWELAERFEHVIATDASAEQLRHATAYPRIEYREATAERSGLDEASVSAVIVATAVHWFDLAAFVSEVERVLKPGGLLAFWTYSWSDMDPEVKAVTARYAGEIVGDFWSPNVKSAWGGYGDYRVGIPELDVPPFEARAEWTADELLGYLCTWSASQSWARAHGRDPTELIADDLRAAYGARDRVEIRWPLFIRAFRRA